MPVVVRRPAPPLDGLVTAITYRAGEQPCTSVEKILPGPGTALWVNLNRDEFRSFGDTGRVNRAPGAMIAGPTSRASVIEFEAGHAHVSVAFALDASVNNLAVHTHPAMDMVVTPYPEEWAGCHIHAHRDGAPAGSGGSTGLERLMGRVLAAAWLVVSGLPGERVRHIASLWPPIVINVPIHTYRREARGAVPEGALPVAGGG
jgi:hypothetical protein